MNKLDELFAPVGALMLRLALGSMWLSHAMLKWSLFTLPGFATWLETQGLSALFAWPVFLLELIGGLLIIMGVFGRYVSIILLPVLLVATWTHASNGWVFTNQGGGWEYPVFLIIASLAHVLIGDGAYAMKPYSKSRLKNANANA
ncbi:MAG: DoxX family protein [Gammaproteobacteria bacterium]|nr:DoxX family protein [Gammaproteobacteria bacterium]MDH5728119.1 DoxX family protein [Gammaproteobacteria bacterium]